MAERICQRCGHHNQADARFCLSCGAMLDTASEAQANDDPLLGRVLLGRYRPLSVLGEGGMGKVYLSEQKMGAATRKVAIKTLHPELSDDPQLVARFHRESETVIELRHPNTIQFYDFGELEDNTLIIVMEYIEGDPLAKVLQEEGALAPSRADKIVIQICGSLHEAHQRGIIHRDLKPENVLLTNQGGQVDFVKVLDFGIAKRDDAEDPQQAKLTKQGMVLGTPPYMSPEQFSGQKLDPRSDVYSLGIMAYEMLTGRLPFEAATPWEWATKHLTAQPMPISSHPAGANIPAAKANAVLRALAKDRNHRQDSVLTFLREFTGQQDADSAWTMATSAGGPVPATSVGPAARPPAPTPAAMPQQRNHPAAFTPTEGIAQMGSAPGLPTGSTGPMAGQPYGSQPGISQAGISQPGVAHPGASHPGMSQPGVHTPGAGFPAAQQSFGGGMSHPQMSSGAGQYPVGYPTGSHSTGGGGRLWLLLGAALVAFLFLASGAAAIFYVATSGGESDPVATNSPTDGSDTDPGTGDPQTGDPTRDGPGTTVENPVNPVNPDSRSLPPMVPTTPMQPLTPTESPATPEETTPTKRPPPRRGPTPAQEAQARQMVATGMGSAQRNDFAGAIAALRQAQRLVGRRSPITRGLQDELGRRGSNQIGILLQQGNCPAAQQLYRSLRPVGAASSARRHFTDWCRPR